LRDVANQYHDWVEPYFRHAQPDQVVVIIKAREPAGIMTAIGAGKKWHLETKYRWVKQYNFYVQDAEWERCWFVYARTFLSPPGSA